MTVTSTNTRRKTFAIAGFLLLALTISAGAIAIALAFGLKILALASILGPAVIFGAVTVTYEYPVAGTTAPTAGNQTKDLVVANVIATADADVTAVITHNLGLSAAELAAGMPRVTVMLLISQALTALAAWTVTTIAANSITLTKLASTGSGNAGAQIRVHIERPHTIGR